MTGNLTPTEDNFHERRIYPRIYPRETLTVNLNSLGADEVYHQFICLDISESGLKIRCAANYKLPFGESSLIEVRLQPPIEQQPISFLTRIQRVQDGDDHRLLALRIVQIGVRDKEILRHMIH